MVDEKILGKIFADLFPDSEYDFIYSLIILTAAIYA